MEFEQESSEPGLAHILLFHDEFFISSTMSNENSQLLYSYLVGCSEALREDRRMKCFSFKEISKNVQTIVQGQVSKKMPDGQANDKAEEEKSGQEFKTTEKQENLEGQSDFCRINPQNSFTFVSKTLHGFVIGPHNFSDSEGLVAPTGKEGQKQSAPQMQNFSPTVYLKDEKTGEIKVYRLMVYIGHKTMLALLFDVDFVFEYDFLSRLDAHLAKHAPIISQLIDISVNKVLQPDDPCKFFYYNEGNMAVKVSNLITREVFNFELKLALDQMHQAFMEDEDLQEQQQNNQQYWLVGINTCGREVYMIMPGTYSSTKVETEKKKNVSLYFQNLFL